MGRAMEDGWIGTKPGLGPRQRRTPEAQRKAILDAAKAVFLERGYAGASIDAVVERAGGSKATVYALFGNKDGLLSALVAEGAERIAAAIRTVPVCTSLKDSLHRVGAAYFHVVLEPQRLALFRLVAGESGQRPEVGDIFYRLGPQAGHKLMAEFIRKCAASDMLEAPDPEALADCFIHSLLGDLWARALFNPTRAPTANEVAHHLDFVVDLFMRAVGRRTGDFETAAAGHEEK